MTKTSTLNDPEEREHRFDGEIVMAVLERRTGDSDDVMNLKVRVKRTVTLTDTAVKGFKGGVLYFDTKVGRYRLDPMPRGSVPRMEIYAHAKALAESKPETADMLPIGDKAFEPSKRAKAILRALEYAKADLEAAGGAFSLRDVRALFGDVSRQAISKRVRDGSLFAIQGKKGATVYPTLQFGDDGQPLAGLKNVLEALPTRSGWAVLNFLINPHNDLDGEIPINALRAGAVDDVILAARRMATQGG
jgi:hypothetical protein